MDRNIGLLLIALVIIMLALTCMFLPKLLLNLKQSRSLLGGRTQNWLLLLLSWCDYRITR